MTEKVLKKSWKFIGQKSVALLHVTALNMANYEPVQGRQL